MRFGQPDILAPEEDIFPLNILKIIVIYASLNCLILRINAFYANIQKNISDAIEHADDKICIAVAWFTNKSLMASLEKKLSANQRIELVILNDCINFRTGGINFQKFIDKGGKLYISHLGKKLHNKFCTVDHKFVITGSYNWTYYAESRNFENIIVTDNEVLIESYRKEFENLKNNSTAIERLNRFHALYPPLSGADYFQEYLDEDILNQLEIERTDASDAYEMLSSVSPTTEFRGKVQTILGTIKPELKSLIDNKQDAVRCLMSRFYNWDVTALQKYADKVDVNLLLVNPNILWTTEKIDLLKLTIVQKQIILKNGRFDNIDKFLYENQENIDWAAISQNPKVEWSELTLERFKLQIKWNWFIYKSSFNWDISKIERFGVCFDNWNNISGTDKIEWTSEVIERFENKWNWDILSQNPNLPWSDALFRKFLHKWDFKSLSGNLSFKWDFKIFEEFEDKWSIYKLQTNPGMCWDEQLIRKYIQQLDPMKILKNPCIYWSAQMIENMIGYLDQYVLNPFKGWTYISGANGSWMSQETLSRFENKIAWYSICNSISIDWQASFIERFKRRLFVNYQGFMGGINGLCENQTFPWTISLVRDAKGAMDCTYGVAWRNLCSNPIFEISGEFIEEFINDVHFGALSGNPGFKITEALLDRYIDKEWYWRLISKRTDFYWTDSILNKYEKLDWEEIAQNQSVYQLVVQPMLNPMMMEVIMNDKSTLDSLNYLTDSGPSLTKCT